MHPVASEGRASAVRFALGDLVLVVRKDQVSPSRVDVDLLAQSLLDHRRALDMPPGATRAPWTVPGGLSLLRAFPEREVTRVLLARLNLHASARHNALFLRPARELAVLRE